MSSSDCERGMDGESGLALVVDLRRVVLRGGLSGNEPDDDVTEASVGGCGLIAGNDECELDLRPCAPGHGQADEVHT
jgi:hypothetical protein